jgi:hypothetical protein
MDEGLSFGYPPRNGGSDGKREDGNLLRSLPVTAGLIVFHIVLEAGRVMAEISWKNGGRAVLAELAGT